MQRMVSREGKTPPQRGTNIIFSYMRESGESSILGVMKFTRGAVLGLVLAAAWLAACAPATPLSTPIARPTAEALRPPPAAPPLQPRAAVRFQHFSIEDGLSQSVVNAMAQDKTGFVWLGTESGLNRYDGYDFTVFNSDPSDLGSLSDGWVTALLADADGSVWVGTAQGGLNRYDPQTGKFSRYRNDPADSGSLTGGSVTSIYRDHDGNLWVGTGKGLSRWNPGTDTFTRYVSDEKEPASISSSAVTTIFQDSGERLWVGTTKGLNLFHPADQSFSHYVSVAGDASTLSNDEIDGMAEDHWGNLWVGTGKGLNRFDPGTGKFFRYMNDIYDPGSLVFDDVQDLLVDSNGTLWVATDGGLDRYDPSHDEFIHYRSNPLVQNSLSVNVVYSMLEDREGVLWFGTWGGGVNKYDRQQNQFALYRNDPEDSRTVNGGGVFPIYADTDGIAWIGVFGGGLERFDAATGSFTHYMNDPKNPDSLNSSNVWSITRDHDGVLWLGTSRGLDQFNERNRKFTHFRFDQADPHSINSDAVMALYADRAGNLWVGTDKGLDRYDPTSNQFIHYSDPADPDYEAPVAISRISEDHLGNLWISTAGVGLYYFDVKAKSFRRFSHDAEDPNSLADNIILWTYEDPQNNVWIATAGRGLNKYNPSTGTFALYTSKQGLANDFTYCVIPDEDGFLWIATNHGISRFNPVQQTFRNYTVADGLQGNEFNSNACARASDGSLYVGGLEGFNHFFPRTLGESAYEPAIVLTSLTQDGKPLAASAAADAIRQITLKSPQNSFEFEFASLGFSQPERSQYAYVLDGFDTDWNALGTKRDGRYTNLPGGDYVLRLRASNRDGVWTEASSPVRVTVIPPFWQTWWFFGLSGLALAGAGFGAYRLRIRSVEAQKIELERQVKERTLEIERLFEQTKELAIIEERNRLARELHDSAKQKAFAALAQLGTAGGLIHQNAGAAQAHINEAENLVYDVIQELTFLIQEMYPLALQEKGLAAVLREYVFEWETRTGIRATIRIENERRLPPQVEQALYRIAQEALANIARHSGASQADIQVLYEPESVNLCVSDNGQGFDQSQKPKGIGLRSIQERAESVGGQAEVKSAPGSGTHIRVTVTLETT